MKLKYNIDEKLTFLGVTGSINMILSIALAMFVLAEMTGKIRYAAMVGLCGIISLIMALYGTRVINGRCRKRQIEEQNK